MQLLFDSQCLLGEGPVWDDRRQCLFWTDIDGKEILASYDGVSYVRYPMDRRVGGIALHESGDLLLFADYASVLAWNPGEAPRELMRLPHEEGRRFNDGNVDSLGRCWFGTYGDSPGTLYRFELDGSVTVVHEDVLCSNGIDWTLDGATMYFVDSARKQIYTYRDSVFTTFLEWQGPGVPDGLTVDTLGNLWVAIWGEACVVKLLPSGELLTRYETGVPSTTCPVFAGAALDRLIVTTSRYSETPPASAGGVFSTDAVGRGKPANRARIPI